MPRLELTPLSARNQKSRPKALLRGDTRASAVAPAETRKSHQAGNVLISGEAAEAEATRGSASGTLAPSLTLDKQFLSKILFSIFAAIKNLLPRRSHLCSHLCFPYVKTLRSALPCLLPSPHTNQQWIQIRRNLFNVGSIFHPSNEKKQERKTFSIFLGALWRRSSRSSIKSPSGAERSGEKVNI